MGSHVNRTIEPEDHVPTAAQVTRVFSQQRPDKSFFRNPEEEFLGGDDSEPVETVDFNSIGEFMNKHAHTSHERSMPAGESLTQGPSILNEIKAALSVVGQNISTDATNEPKRILLDSIGSQATEQSSTVLITDSQISAETSATRITQISNTVDNLDASAPGMAQPVQQAADELSNAPGGLRPEKDDEIPPFTIDPNPATGSERIEMHVIRDTASDQPLGLQLPDEEVIVYDAPNPRSGRATPNVTQPSNDESVQASASTLIASTSKIPEVKSFHETSFSFAGASKVAETNREIISTPRSRRLTKKGRQAARRVGRFKRSSFGMAGAMLEELHLHDEDDDETRGNRRYGSDIDWGDEDDDKVPEADSEMEKVSNGLDGMTIDSDVNLESMQSFVKSMSNEGFVYNRIDDSENEDDEAASEDSEDDSELDAIVAAEEELLVGEDNDAEDLADKGDEDEESSDDGESPNRNFQARLERARQIARGKQKENSTAAKPLFQSRMLKLRQANETEFVEAPDSDEEDWDESYTKAEETEDFFADLQVIARFLSAVLIIDLRSLRTCLTRMTTYCPVKAAKRRKHYFHSVQFMMAISLLHRQRRVRIRMHLLHIA